MIRNQIPEIRNLIWCPGSELNWRHKDFQSFALPLSYRGVSDFGCRISDVRYLKSDIRYLKFVAGVGFEPTTFRLWAWRAANCSTPLCRISDFRCRISDLKSEIWNLKSEIVGAHGFEPWTSSLSEKRSSQLSYAPFRISDIGYQKSDYVNKKRLV